MCMRLKPVIFTDIFSPFLSAYCSLFPTRQFWYYSLKLCFVSFLPVVYAISGFPILDGVFLCWTSHLVDLTRSWKRLQNHQLKSIVPINHNHKYIYSQNQCHRIIVSTWQLRPGPHKFLFQSGTFIKTAFLLKFKSSIFFTKFLHLLPVRISLLEKRNNSMCV